MPEKFVYLMRGLPSTGKSFTAKKLAGESGAVCETDEFFYAEVGDDPAKYDYREDLKQTSRAWNFARFQRAVDAGITPIVVDRGNSLSVESQRYARYAVERGYRVELKEPESGWWQELRVLLKYKQFTGPVLTAWAERLAAMSRRTHRVPASIIRRRMERWRFDLTVEEILAYSPTNKDQPEREAVQTVPDPQPVPSVPITQESDNAVPPSTADVTSRGWLGDFLLNLGGSGKRKNRSSTGSA